MLYAYPDMLKDGPHTLQVSFPEESWSDETLITLKSKPWPAIVEIRSLQDSSRDRTIQGVINPQSTDPQGTIQVNVYFHHLGEPEWIPLDITRKTRKDTGEVYFTFKTEIVRIPAIAKDDRISTIAGIW